MSTVVKLTNRGFTQNSTKWRVGVVNKLPKRNNPQLCSEDVFHAYQFSLDLALLLNPMHANFSPEEIVAFECKGEIATATWDKCGLFELTPVRELPLPKWFVEPKLRVRVQIWFAVLAALEVLPIFEQDLPNDDRPRKAIEAAIAYLENPSNAAADAAHATAYTAHAAAYTAHADYAAYAAAYAARAAAYIAHVVDAVYTAYYTAHVAHVVDAVYTAYYAAHVAHAARDTNYNIDLEQLAQKAVKKVIGEN